MSDLTGWKIGLIGLGHMGKPMARNLHKAGAAVTVSSRSPGPVEELAGEGLTIVLSSHRLHELQPVLTHAAILLRGRVARSGSITELLGSGDRHHLSGGCQVCRPRTPGCSR